MSKFNKGDKVLYTLTQENGFIIEVYNPRRGHQLYRVKFETRVEDVDSSDLLPDADLSDPFERCRENIFDYYTEYLKENTAFKIQSSNNSTISSLKASRTLFRPYQFKPLLKFLNSDNRRILIADEVGLGKTIEAGHIMLELKARDEFYNSLVICPKSLVPKWTTELNEKFGLNFIAIESKNDLLHEMQYHNGNVRAVVNYDKFRENSDILNYILEKNVKFSFVVCDESHRLRNNNTQIYRGISRFTVLCDSMVFMSATPIMIDENNLYNQLHLLDENLYDNREVFMNNLRLNRPFLTALSELKNDKNALKDIFDELAESRVSTYNIINDVEFAQDYTIGEYFQDYPIFHQIAEEMTSGTDSLALRAKIQYNLSEMNPMNVIFSRTRKREVTQDWSQAERDPHTVRVDLTAAESQLYNEAIDDYVDEHTVYDEYGRPQGGRLGLVTIKRQLASSIHAYAEKEGMEKEEDFDDEDSKFRALLGIIKEVFSHGHKKIIVFAIFKKTLHYLQGQLAEEGYKSVMIYGDTKINRAEVLNQFQYDDNIQVLLSSEVGSEGLDMQFCNTLVNYDLPWNPMVVEQRIGRIDRFGQESPKVHIYNIVVNESILEDIYERLLMRIGIFRESIGDLEAILDAELEKGGITIRDAIKNMERDFYSDVLSVEEVERKQLEIEQAIENERLNLKKIEDGLTNTLTNDSYFKDEINRIINNNAYVTKNELYQLIIQLLKDTLTTCEIRETIVPGIYEFVLPKSDPRVLKRFLDNNVPIDIDSQRLYNSFIGKIEDHLSFKLTFDQELAFHDKRLEYINIYHPLIKAAVKWYSSNQDKKKNTFFFELRSDNLPSEIARGQYMLGIYKVSVSRNVFGNNQLNTDSLYPVLFDIKNNCVIEDSDLCEKFMGCAQTDGRYAPMDESFHATEDFVNDLRYDFTMYVKDHVNIVRSDLADRIENSKRMRSQQTIQYYESRIERYKRNIEMQEYILQSASSNGTNEGTLRMMRANLKELEQEKQETIDKINENPNLKVTSEIMSLNLVNVI
ncbi:MAG: DEAD/DEAH box helicase family protein [Bacteroidaceae bacterium]|nr:DEAD/DEAH box helicase family protein [Bacteroidaceae bacterium]